MQWNWWQSSMLLFGTSVRKPRPDQRSHSFLYPCTSLWQCHPNMQGIILIEAFYNSEFLINKKKCLLLQKKKKYPTNYITCCFILLIFVFICISCLIKRKFSVFMFVYESSCWRLWFYTLTQLILKVKYCGLSSQKNICWINNYITFAEVDHYWKWKWKHFSITHPFAHKIMSKYIIIP